MSEPTSTGAPAISPETRTRIDSEIARYPRKRGALLPAPDLVLTFAERDDSRYIRCEAQTERGERLARRLDQAI